MRKKLKTALRMALLIFASAVLGVNLYLWNARSLMGNALPMPFGYGVAVVLTGSMEPAIMVDDLILVQEAESYEVGDIVAYQNGSIIVVHRIQSIHGESVVTKGDANNAADAPIAMRYIKGRVVGHIPNMGRYVRAIKSPAGTFLLIAAAIFLPELSYRREKQKDENELDKLKEEIRRLKDEI